MYKKEKERLFEELIDQNRSRIYRICRSYLRNQNDISDLYQEILIGIWKAIDRFREESSWNTYIYRIAVNTAIKYQIESKKRKEHPTILREIPAEPTSNGYREKEEMLNKMDHCIQMLKDTDRMLILLVLEDLSYKEIAEILESNINLVGVQINRVKKRMIKLMEEHYG